MENGETALLFDEAQSEAWRAEIERILRENGFCAGMSGPFALAASARGCLTKARIALETGRALAPGRALYDMETYGEAALLRTAKTALEAQGFCAEDFCDAAIEGLARLDEQGEAQYVRSLHAYLSSGLNLRRAAETMGIHRNTLAYRMRRIEARFALNLGDMNTCFELLFSLWLRDGIGGEVQPESTEPFDSGAVRAALWRFTERTGGAEAPCGGRFKLAVAAVGVGNMGDEKRMELTLALCALPQKPVAAFDEETLFLALPPEEIDAFANGGGAALRGGARGTGDFTAVCHGAAKRAAAPVPALRCWRRARQTMEMRDMGSTLFFMALERKISLAPYLCEDVIRVMDEDATRGSALSRALYAYLLNFMDFKKAAHQLGIHRNTLEYQVRKMNAVHRGTAGRKQAVQDDVHL